MLHQGLRYSLRGAVIPQPTALRALSMAVLVQQEVPLLFKPGQWVDFFVPAIRQVGGYSICSTPQEALDSNTFELAVKLSSHPPARWLHEEAKAGAEVQVKVGGTCTLETEHLQGNLLLVGGGIGITALASIIGRAIEIQERALANGQPTIQMILLYSAKSLEEFALLNQLQQYQKRSNSRFQLWLHTTSSSPEEEPAMPPGTVLRRGRITGAVLNEALDVLEQHSHEMHGSSRHFRTSAFVCGPPSFAEQVIKHLSTELGFPYEQIMYEKWW